MRQFFTILFILLLGNPFLQAQSIPLSKERTLELYDSLYVSSAIDSIIWNGDIQSCNPGTLSNEIYLKAQNRINFFRLVSGLSTVKNNPEFNLRAQNAALLSKANKRLTHYPKSTAQCFSTSAAKGCELSCLAITDWKNFPKTAFINHFIWDYGESNDFVGHRKWLLYTRLIEFGYGATNSSEAILTADGVTYDAVPSPEFIAYPWNGFVPIDLIYPKWSFSIPKGNTVDFSNATILLTDADGNDLKLDRLEEGKGFLDHTLVWSVSGLFNSYDIVFGNNSLEENGYLNNRITVEINGVVVNGETKDYKYFVEPI